MFNFSFTPSCHQISKWSDLPVIMSHNARNSQISAASSSSTITNSDLLDSSIQCYTHSKQPKQKAAAFSLKKGCSSPNNMECCHENDKMRNTHPPDLWPSEICETENRFPEYHDTTQFLQEVLTPADTQCHLNGSATRVFTSGHLDIKTRLQINSNSNKLSVLRIIYWDPQPWRINRRMRFGSRK